VLGLPANKAADEAFERARGGGGGGIRRLDLRSALRIDRHVAVDGKFEKTASEVGIVGGERGIDLARGGRGSEDASDGMLGKRARIVLRGDEEAALERARHERDPSAGEGERQNKRQRDARPGHAFVSCPRPMSAAAGTPARCRSGKFLSDGS